MNVGINSIQQKASEDNSRNNNTLADSKANLSNSDDNKIAAEQNKNYLLNNRSSLNHIESTDNSKGATTNALNSWLNNSNSVDATFVKETTQNHTTFPIQPPTNPNYNPNSEADPANTLTKNSTDQQDGNGIPITDSLKIIIANNSKDEDSRTNEHPGQK